MLFVAFPLVAAAVANAAANATLNRCRSQPGDVSFPTSQELSHFNASIGGRLIRVVPSAQFCKERGCTDNEWSDTIFRSSIPGAMDEVNWEQDYTSSPPSLCFRDTAVCGQGNVPLYAVNATLASHVQAGVRFAQTHNLKVAIKASGHDYLGRSTAKNSFLVWTRYMENITFHHNFKVGHTNEGSAVTVGSGVGLSRLYQASKAQGKIFVGGLAQNVVPAGGYFQGAGHSPLSPKFGLAADNTLEFQIVLADGSLVTANAVSHSDLFWAVRGGGPGSWGVIISATFRTYPNFNIVTHQAFIALNSSTAAGAMAELHSSHIWDWDEFSASQLFYVLPATPPSPVPWVWASTTYFPNSSIEVANASMAPFMSAIAENFPIVSVALNSSLANDQFSTPTINDILGINLLLTSRLISDDVYRNNATGVRDTYKKLLDEGTLVIAGHLIAGGQVAANKNIDSAVNPKWRTAKTHVGTLTEWEDGTSPADVEAILQVNTNERGALLEALAGPGSGSYTNEGDVHEPHYQTTFYGPNYARLTMIKALYDPNDLFIVGAGVGSERWDKYGLCKN